MRGILAGAAPNPDGESKGTMAKTRTKEPPIAESLVRALDPAPVLPTFRRANRQDAEQFARATFLHGTRLDMGTMAEQLDVSRATLYRWCGSREALHERILERRADEFSAWACGRVRGKGDERLIDMLRLIMRATLDAQPVRRFMEREPKLALRVLTRRDGLVHCAISRALEELAAEAGPSALTAELRGRISDAVYLGSVLQWTTIATEEMPDTEYILGILRRQLTG